MLKSLNLTLFLAVFAIGFVLSVADTQILHTIGIPVENSYRQEVISLDEDQHLLVEGSFHQAFEIPHDDKNRLNLYVVYMIDKNVHKVKYTLNKKEPVRPAVQLSVSTLKSSAG